VGASGQRSWATLTNKGALVYQREHKTRGEKIAEGNLVATTGYGYRHPRHHKKRPYSTEGWPRVEEGVDNTEKRTRKKVCGRILTKETQPLE